MSFNSMIVGALVFFATALASAAPPPAENVVLVMLDGVRWQEFFSNKPWEKLSNDTDPIFGRFWTGLASQGVIYGSPASRFREENRITVANPVRVSLPAYQSIMAGATQPCLSNECGRVTVETFPERLVRGLKLDRRQVATIASWNQISNAFEHVSGATFTNTGQTPLKVEDPSGTHERINKSQEHDPAPWGDPSVRLDKYTFRHALHYLVTQRPRFLFISLNDSDEWAHAGDYPRLMKTLRGYDARLDLLFRTLEKMGEYGAHTTVLVTTDHGRGSGTENWRDHGLGVPEADRIWLYARGPHTPRAGAVHGAPAHSHLDIRPTVELLLGLCPLRGPDRGKPFDEVTVGVPRPLDCGGAF
jgi:hypothetical protein